MSGTVGSQAFDALAPRYDQLFSPQANPLVALMRGRVHAILAQHFPPAATLLELGCGTGEDTLALTERGHTLVAADPAPAMLARAQAKLADAGRADSVRFVNAGAAALAEQWPSLGALALTELGFAQRSRRGKFQEPSQGSCLVDGAFSNFAPLNCELSLDPLRRLLQQALPPGGRFVGVVLPRLCPLEIALFLARGEPRTALRRFRRNPVADVDGVRFPMRYYGVRDFDAALGPGFRRIQTRSLGLVLPPLSFGPALARRPRLMAALAAVEDRLAGVAGLSRMGDHVILAYEKL